MAQTRVNGAVEAGQFLTGSLNFFIIDEVAESANIANFGFTAGSANPGEKVILAMQTVANPVIIESASDTVMYVATEVNGVTAAALQTAIRSAGGLDSLTVTAGTLTVV